MADTMHACTICNAVATEPDIAYAPASERARGGWACRNANACRRRLHARLRKADAAWFAQHGETTNTSAKGIS